MAEVWLEGWHDVVMVIGHRGAGRGGGLLFAAVLAFTAVLAYGGLDGVARLVVVGLLVAGVLAVLASTATRR